jgi:alcohol dehydrogenase class IV
MIPSFVLARLPRIEFGVGTIELLPSAIARHGKRVLIVTGAHAFRSSERWPTLLGALAERGIEAHTVAISGEPSPAMVDEAVTAHRDRDIQVVVGIGGGSVLDASKAIAALLRTGTSVRDHLEGIGPQLPYPGPTVPFIAVPTTAGTGSEATKNAVLSEVGPHGFKRSFRDERLVATEAIVDPDLVLGTPPVGAAANGMDALTQLLESYVSTRTGPLTDALAIVGLNAVRDGLLVWHRSVVEGWPAEESADARSAMSLAALVSGICLAQTGLGAIHGLAAPVGAAFPIPHGAACGALAVATVRVNIQALEEREPESETLGRYARAGRILARRPDDIGDAEARESLVAELDQIRRELEMAGLAAWGMTEEHIPMLVAGSRGSSMRTNPIVLGDAEVTEILRSSL